MPQDLGSIYTPSAYADFLVSWAIRNRDEIVMDLGIGGGSFVFAAHNRLVELGADSTEAQKQIYGAEIDSSTFESFMALTDERNAHFPNLQNVDFFTLNLPQVDVIVGNPPYVRRMNIKSTDSIRKMVVNNNPLILIDKISRLTDLYVYFLLYALPKLKPGGRLAVITADSWLNVSYGEILKDYLLKEFDIDSLISLDRRVFQDAQVKPAMILATKKSNAPNHDQIRFFRVKNGLPIGKIKEFVEIYSGNVTEYQDVVVRNVKTADIESSSPWGTNFKLPWVYDKLAQHSLLTPISSIAQTRVGLQTLAKDFFVLTQEQITENRVEEQFLRPLAQSPRYFNQPIISPGTAPDFYIFYCADGKSSLGNTRALEYILSGETKEVQVRGKQTKVIGYQNKKRIQEASRKNWYDLASALEKRGIAEILIPRLVYRTFNVVWNQASFVPGELFIEFLPLPLPEVDIEVYLAILTSSVTEIMLRAHAQVYGGGTYNINPGQIKKVPILNAHLLNSTQRQSLKQAYINYLTDDYHNRSGIDKVVFDILGFSETIRKQVVDAVDDLITIATSTKQNHLDAKSIE